MEGGELPLGCRGEISALWKILASLLKLPLGKDAACPVLQPWGLSAGAHESTTELLDLARVYYLLMGS